MGKKMPLSEKRLEANRKNALKGGRPESTATLQAQLFRDALAKRITRDADKWMGAIQDAALGHYLEVKQKDGTVKVYKTKPNPDAWSKATERAFGKPKQVLGTDDEDGAPFQIVVVKYEPKE